MARAFQEYEPKREGALEVEVSQPGVVDVYYIPPESLLREARIEPEEAQKHRTKLLGINGLNRSLTIFPISTLPGRSRFLKPKYGQIERISLDDTGIIFAGYNDFGASGRQLPTTPVEVIEMLEGLPSAFIKDYAYGLGLAKPYRFIIDAVETLSECTEIVITDKVPTGPSSNGKQFNIAEEDFEQARRALNSVNNLAQTAARAVKDVVAHNILAERIGAPKLDPKAGRHPFRKLFTAAAQGQEELSKEDQNKILGAISSHAYDIAKEQPAKLAKLRGDIELVTLEALVQRFEAMLGENLIEGKWQNFFNENTFILNMAFGYPVIKVRDQASVGGRKLSGEGEKITDFLIKNSLTNNTAIFEIKTPQTALLNKNPFREGVYTPSADLSGSINQALDQKYQFQKQIAQIKDTSRLYDIESYAVHCCLVIGRIPDGDDRKKSFELFRRNSKEVEIVTFDELLEKLKQLGTFLRATEKEASS